MKKIAAVVFVLSFILIPCFSADIFAEEIAFDEENAPTVDEVVSALKPDDQPDIKLRGINYKPEMAEPKMISVELQFEKDSAELTEGTKNNLIMIGKALNSEDLKDLKFTLEGHADASGSAEYNMSLSRERAESVKKFLVDNHNVNPENLLAVGKGESDLLDPENPNSMKNRRVRIITGQ